LIKLNEGAILKIVKKYCYTKEDMEDLFNNCVIGMMEAIKNFNIDLDNNFLTYCFYYFKREAINFSYKRNIVNLKKSQKLLHDFISKGGAISIDKPIIVDGDKLNKEEILKTEDFSKQLDNELDTKKICAKIYELIDKNFSDIDKRILNNYIFDKSSIKMCNELNTDRKDVFRKRERIIRRLRYILAREFNIDNNGNKLKLDNFFNIPVKKEQKFKIRQKELENKEKSIKTIYINNTIKPFNFINCSFCGKDILMDDCWISISGKKICKECSIKERKVEVENEKLNWQIIKNETDIKTEEVKNKTAIKFRKILNESKKINKRINNLIECKCGVFTPIHNMVFLTDGSMSCPRCYMLSELKTN
jgi:RNA polymerase sigma factor (sigma-70 family)